MQILFVGNESAAHSVNHAAMAVDHEVTAVNDVEEGMIEINGEKPSLIVLEAPTLEEDLVECSKLEAHTDAAERPPVVFLAERGSFEDKVSCYEAGAYDFITTPISEHELRERMRIIQQHISRQNELSQQLKTATETALSVMAGNNELGQAIRFVEKSYLSGDYEELANHLLSVTTSLGLRGCLLVDAKDDMQFYGSCGHVSPLEQQLLERVHDDGTRFRDFGRRTLIDYPLVTLLIKDMPLDDPDRYGRLKDLFPSMLGAASARVAALNTEMALQRQTRDVGTIYQNVRNTLLDLRAASQENQAAVMKTMREMLGDLDFKLPSMGLEPDQEEYLIARVDTAIEEAGSLIQQSEGLTTAFDHISDLLDHLALQQREIVEMVAREAEDPDDAGSGDDIELF